MQLSDYINIFFAYSTVMIFTLTLSDEKNRILSNWIHFLNRKTEFFLAFGIISSILLVMLISETFIMFINSKSFIFTHIKNMALIMSLTCMGYVLYRRVLLAISSDVLFNEEDLMCLKLEFNKSNLHEKTTLIDNLIFKLNIQMKNQNDNYFIQNFNKAIKFRDFISKKDIQFAMYLNDKLLRLTGEFLQEDSASSQEHLRSICLSLSKSLNQEYEFGLLFYLSFVEMLEVKFKEQSSVYHEILRNELDLPLYQISKKSIERQIKDLYFLGWFLSKLNDRIEIQKMYISLIMDSQLNDSVTNFYLCWFFLFHTCEDNTSEETEAIAKIMDFFPLIMGNESFDSFGKRVIKYMDLKELDNLENKLKMYTKKTITINGQMINNISQGNLKTKLYTALEVYTCNHKDSMNLVESLKKIC